LRNVPRAERVDGARKRALVWPLLGEQHDVIECVDGGFVAYLADRRHLHRVDGRDGRALRRTRASSGGENPSIEG
jgi:hypothetical protein